MTLVEVLAALVLASILGAAAFRTLLAFQEAFRVNTERARGNDTLRAAALILPEEFRELSGNDSLGSDILDFTSSSVRYRAFRALGIACRPPDPDALAITLWDDAMGLRGFDQTVDSVLMLAHGDPVRQSENRWVHADVISVDRGAWCPGDAGGERLGLGGVSPDELRAVHRGAPVRGFEISEVNRYQDGRGAWWVGMRRYQKDTGWWPAIQPLLGPLAPGGLEFLYLDAAGLAAEDADRIGLVGARVTVPATGSGSPRTADFRVGLRGSGPW